MLSQATVLQSYLTVKLHKNNFAASQRKPLSVISDMGIQYWATTVAYLSVNLEPSNHLLLPHRLFCHCNFVWPSLPTLPHKQQASRNESLLLYVITC